MKTSQNIVLQRNNSNTNEFKAIFQSGFIGPMQLKNRIIMAAMGNALADDKGNVTEGMLEYYRARARGGSGMIITQFAAVCAEDVMPYNLSIYDDAFVSGLKKLVQTIHEQGAKACIQLMHPGMLFLLFKTIPQGISIKVPSITPRMGKDKQFREISIGDIERYIISFGEAAARAKAAGADAVELHACHGCLLSSFLSPAINRRTDTYGGSIENRVRFVEQVVEHMRQKIGLELPLIVRINGSDDVEGGVSTDEVIQQAAVLSKAGASAISISSGLEYWSTLMAPSYLTPNGVMIPIAEKVKKAVNVPVIVSGKINPEIADETINSGKADFIAMGRPLLADPELPNKLLQGKSREVYSCLYCNNCLRTSWRSCTVNPFLYREQTSGLLRTASPKKIMVVGGGLAGMEAAVLCKIRGHEVSLFERQPEMGGQWNVACKVPGKEEYASIIKHLVYLLEKIQVPVSLNTLVTADKVREVQPEVVVVATGAAPMTLDVSGANGQNVIQANDVITNKVETKGKIVVIGGNMVGLEVAVSQAEQGKEVTLVSHGALGGRKGPDDMITFRGLMRRIARLRVPVYLNAEILEISENNLLINIGQEILPLQADTIVVAIGVKPVDSLVRELKGIVPEIYAIGDSVMPGNAAQATYSAARLVSKL